MLKNYNSGFRWISLLIYVISVVAINATKVTANEGKIIVNNSNHRELLNHDIIILPHDHKPVISQSSNANVPESENAPTTTENDNSDAGNEHHEIIIRQDDNKPVISQSSDVDVPESENTPTTTENDNSDAGNEQKIYVRQIKVLGSTVLSENELNEIVKPFTEKELTQEEIRKAADAITQVYLNKNYLNSRAIPVTQTDENTKNGVVVIQVVEGSLAEIQIVGTKRLSQNYIRERIKLGAGVPLNAIKLEEQLRLLRIDPLFNNIEASLRPSGQVGKSILVVRVEEAKSFEFGVSADNYSNPNIGAEKLGIQLRERNLTGRGDELAASYYRTVTGGANLFDFSYQIPVNAMDGKVQIRYAPSDSKITSGLFKDLDISAENDLYEINYRQPLVRTPREEFALSLGFTHQNGQTFLFDSPTPFGEGPDTNGVSRTSVINFAQDYVKRDTQGAWSLRSQLNFGTGLFDATTSDDPVPDGRFFSWLGQIQRVQRLSEDHLLIFQADLQLSPDSLLPAQQFVIGGGQSVRGYRQNARSGDNGFRIAIEDRITVQRNASGSPMIQVIPFTNIGAVWNKSDNPNDLPNQTFLASAGLGLLWNQALGIDGLIMRLDYGIPFVDLDDRGNNAQDDGFHFSIRYQQ
jgi:hemolysin activation/secretion protein